MLNLVTGKHIYFKQSTFKHTSLFFVGKSKLNKPKRGRHVSGVHSPDRTVLSAHAFWLTFLESNPSCDLQFLAIGERAKCLGQFRHLECGG